MTWGGLLGLSAWALLPMTGSLARAEEGKVSGEIVVTSAAHGGDKGAEPNGGQNGSLDGGAIPLGRLSDVAKPSAYRLDLTLDPASPRFSGQAQIDLTLAKPQRVLYLHGKGLAVSQVTARVGAREWRGHWQNVDPSGVARLTFPETLPAGAITLTFVYDAAFAQSPAGLFRVEVDGAWYVWTHFQPIEARSAFPGFDQPEFKTPFTITLRTPEGLSAISNAPQVGPVTVEAGKAVHHFAPTAPLPTYLVAMMVGPFAILSGEAAPDSQRSTALPIRIASTSQNKDSLAFGLEGTEQIVRLLEEYFRDPFPFPKIDQVTSPVMSGAMENAGAALYRDDLLVMDSQSPVVQQRRFGTVVAHELGHQWFGDVVTPRWWDDLWLNESFANWIGYRIGDAWRPDLGIMGDALGMGYDAMDTDALLAGRPIHQSITRSSEIDSAFDAITYGKGGHVVGMVAAWLGEERFREGIHLFLARHRFGSATSEDFFSALAEVAGDPKLVPAMRSFVEKQGVPLLAMRRDGDRVYVTQLRYTTAGVAPPPADWIIPLCFRRGGTRKCFIMDQRNQSFVIPGEGPVFPNAQGTGYYRFELTPSHWSELIAQAEHLSGGEALALVDSLWASVRAGRGTIGEMGRLAKKLIRHSDPHAADAPDKALSRMLREGIVRPNGRRGFRQFRETLYAPLLKEYGFNAKAGAYAREAPARAQRRVQIVNALIGAGKGKPIRDAMLQGVEAYLAGDKSALDPAWFDHALDLYLVNRKADAVRELVDRALASEDPVFRPAALAAAARYGQVDMAKWMLALADPRLRESEKREILDGVMARGSTREYGYTWALENADELIAGADGQSFATRLPQMLGRFCSVTWSTRIRKDFTPKLAGTPGALELERAAERVRNCGLLDDMMGQRIEEEFIALQ